MEGKKKSYSFRERFIKTIYKIGGTHFGERRREAVGVVGPRAGGARDKVLPLELAAHQAVLDAGGLVDALVAVPITIRDVGQAGLETVGMVAFVTTITK